MAWWHTFIILASEMLKQYRGGRSPEWGCSVDLGTTITRTKVSDTWQIGKAFPYMNKGQNWQSLLSLAQVWVSMDKWTVWQKLATAASWRSQPETAAFSPPADSPAPSPLLLLTDMLRRQVAAEAAEAASEHMQATGCQLFCTCVCVSVLSTEFDTKDRCAEMRQEIQKVMMYLCDIVRSCLKLTN